MRGLAAFLLFFGRLTAQFGTAVQPMRFEYDEANRMTALHTWRVPEQEMSLSPALRADSDVTRWSYDVASGLLMTKTMPDGKQTVYSYGEKGQLLTSTQANGVKTEDFWWGLAAFRLFSGD